MADPDTQGNVMFQEPTKPDQTVTPDQGVKSPNLDEVFAEHLSSIKNEQGEQKYSDVMTALNALKHTQDHVKNLETENSTLRNEQVKAATMDEVLQQMTANRDQNLPSTQVPSGLDAESVRGIIKDTLQQDKAQETSEANQRSVVEQLGITFGGNEKAEEMYGKKAEELGLTVDTLNQLAASSPKAVLSYFNVKGQVTPIKFNEGSVNTDALQDQQQDTPKIGGVMHGASTSDIVDSWRAAGQVVQNEMEIS